MRVVAAILTLGIPFQVLGCRPPGRLPKGLCVRANPNVAACEANMRKSHQKRVNFVNVSPDGKFIATSATEEGFLWDVISGRLLKTFKSCSVAVGPAGQMASALVGIRYWRTHTVEFVDVQFPNEKLNIVQAAFAANGKLLVGRTDDNLHVKDMQTGKIRSVRTGKMDGMKVSSRGTLAVYKRTHNKIYLVDLRTMKVERLVSYDGPAHGLAISADGRRVAVGNLATGSPSYLEVWDTRSRKRLKRLVVDSSDHEGFPMECDQCLAIGANNGVLVVGSQSKIHLWNLRNWRKVEGVLTRGPGRWGKDRTVSAVDLAGRVLVAGYEDGTVKVWDLCARKSICTH